MSLAWTTVAVLVLLLPGFLFAVWFRSSEPFTSETTSTSPLAQLASTILIALLLHGFLYVLSVPVCSVIGPVPCIDLGLLLATLQLEGAAKTPLDLLAANLQQYRVWIFGYLVMTSSTGAAGGWLAGRWYAKSVGSRIARHSWLYGLKPRRATNKTIRRRSKEPRVATITWVYVFTTIRTGPRALMYSGLLEEFSAGNDGRFSYLVLSSARRGYMLLGTQTPTTIHSDSWATIGEQGAHKVPGVVKERKLLLDRDAISNAVFETVIVRESSGPKVPDDTGEFKILLAEILKEVKGLKTQRQSHQSVDRQ